MASWPSNWKAQALANAGIPASPSALKVMTAWQQSTPLDPWTNNPIGIPSVIGKTQSVPGTRYAMFKTINDFYTAFAAFAKTAHGRSVASEIIGNHGYGPVWRAIAALGWPASATETDWPSKVLDLAGEAYAASVSAAPADARRTAGKPKAPATVHEAMRHQAESITKAAASFNDAHAAVRSLIVGHARYGK